MTDVFDNLDALTVATIGDPITYTPAGGTALSFNAWVDHTPDLIDFGFTAAITAEAAVQIRKIDLPTFDKDGDRIFLPRTGRTYKMATAPLHSRCGRLWNLAIVKVPT
jgi:RecB family endonuclease NucS